MFISEYKITFSETDPGGILFFAEFLKIAHITYERFLDSLNLANNYFLDDEIALPIVHTEADYFTPVKFGDTLMCEVSIGKLTASSFELFYSLKLGTKIASKVITKHVAVSKKEFKKAKIPSELFSALKEIQD